MFTKKTVRSSSVPLVRSATGHADARRLLEHFSGLQADGRIISHEQIEHALRCSRGSSAYRIATKYWRRALLEEQRIYLCGRSAQGKGFMVLTYDDCVRAGGRKFNGIRRRLRDTAVALALPDDSELTDQKVRLFRSRALAAVERVEARYVTTRREMLAGLTPARQIRAAQKSDEGKQG